MEKQSSSDILQGEIDATHREIDASQCIELPVPIYHPAHVNKLKQMLSMLCLKCLKVKLKMDPNPMLRFGNLGVCCEEASTISIREEASDGASYLELSSSGLCWNFLGIYGYRYGSDQTRPLLAREVQEILRRIPKATIRYLTANGYDPQAEYILEYLALPPNCLSDESDGHCTTSSDLSSIELKDVLQKVEEIRSSRSNFESHKADSDDMFRVVDTYLKMRYGPTKIPDSSSSNATRLYDKKLSKITTLVTNDIIHGVKPTDTMSHGGTNINKLFVTRKSLSEGNVNYLVFEGVQSKTTVAIKRVLRSHEADASREEYSNQRQSSEDSANVLSVFDYMCDLTYAYLILEYGPCNLEDIVEFAKKKTWAINDPSKMSIGSFLNKEWGAKGVLSPLKLKLIRDIVNGVKDMHQKKIIHRKLQPRRVQIVVRESPTLTAKITGFESSKYIGGANTSLRFRDGIATDRTQEWLAPEQLRKMDETYAVDLFNMGCLIHYIVFGSHPFDHGDGSNVLDNIRLKKTSFLRQKKKLTPEATHLLQNLLQDAPSLRLSARQTLEHPIFWDGDTRISFLRKVQELYRDGKMPTLLSHMKTKEFYIHGNELLWSTNLDQAFLNYLNKKFSYTYSHCMDLLKLLRNTNTHFDGLPADALVGTNPQGLDTYFTKKFPLLLIEDTEVKLPRPTRVKNKTPAPVQITAEQILREARERQEAEIRPPKQKITDSTELSDYRLRRRKEFEDQIRRARWNIQVWMKYAQWEESQKDYARARSVWERAIEGDYRNHTLWLKYAEFEMKNKFVNSARNVWDRAVTLLPRVDQLWYKYIHMEEILGNIAGARQIFQRWMDWSPDQQGWLSFIKFELRYNEIERARSIYERFVLCHPKVSAYIRYAKFEMKGGEVARARNVYERATEKLADDEEAETLFVAFAEFEERCKEPDRARFIYKFALDHIPKGRAEDLYKKFVAFEKQYGDKEGIEDAIVGKRRFQYEDEVRKNPLNYDSWFDYVRLEETVGNKDRIREIYERAIANVPPAEEKLYWQRYIYLW
ncbi:unnamed protein product [Arabis nemorensis]|uniref:Protein kinase domain-containing protein n=1 Tax=Arabis nemorensis TaxID=586526 RepID=A0A565C7E4_9BRAS|nr:unnamed protein product [Arabis nemorensis]